MTQAFANYEKILRDYIGLKQQGAERFASAFAPKTRWGLLVPQSGHQGFRDSWRRAVYIRPRHHRQPATS